MNTSTLDVNLFRYQIYTLINIFEVKILILKINKKLFYFYDSDLI